jgi:hypothetical protein
MDAQKEEQRWAAFVADHGIVLTETTATMSLNAFGRLDDYSCSSPSGVFIGKIWKAHIPFGGRGHWVLRRYAPHATDPDLATIETRKLYIEHPAQPGSIDHATDTYLDSIKACQALAADGVRP